MAPLGTGYIGLEMADALTRRGIAVTVLKRGEAVLSATVDAPLAAVVEEELQHHGVELRSGVTVEAVQAAGPRSAPRAQLKQEKLRQGVLR